MTLRQLTGAIILSAGLLAGCTTFRGEPTLLPSPPLPVLDWQLKTIEQDPWLCLTPAEGDKLDKYFDQYRAFAKARERLRPQP